MESSVVGGCTNISAITSFVYALELILNCQWQWLDLDSGTPNFTVLFSALHNVHPC